MSKPIRTLSDSDKQILQAAADRLQVGISQKQLQSLAVYLDELARYNEHTNLVSDANPKVVLRDHVIDALALAPLIKAPGSLIDVGSGAGFPALILWIVLPDLSVALVESIAKKARFLEQAAAAISGSHAERVPARVITGRAEEQAHKAELREQFDYATARAVGSLELVAELTMPFLRIGGQLLAPKSRKQSLQEVPAAQEMIRKLGGATPRIVAPDMVATGRDTVIITIEKLSSTPPRYPRPMSQIKRAKK